jgi:hypothetical protein
MSPDCHRKYCEHGLWFEIKCLEELIASPTAKQSDKDYANKLLKSYKRLARKQYAD